MYYPIIDKLKTLMTDIASVKEKEPLTIMGTITSVSGGTWTGDWNDIVTAFSDNKPIYFKVPTGTVTLFVPVISLSNTSASSGILYANNMMVYGSLSNNGTFKLNPVQ